MRTSILIPAGIALAAIWSGVSIVMSATDKYVSSPEKVGALFDNPPWKSGQKPAPAARQTYLDELVKYYLLLDVQQRQALREADPGNTKFGLFMLDLTESERKRYLSAVIESEMRPVMNAWKNISKEERRTMMTSARAKMRRDGRDVGALDRLLAADERVFEKLIDGDIASFYQSADDQGKLNLAPLMEELQAKIQGFRRGR
jgi:hypothetical protein